MARTGHRIPYSFSFRRDPQDEAYGKTRAAPMPGTMAFYGWFDRIHSRCRREKAQTMAEYAVVLGVIVPAIVLSYSLFADRIAQLIDSVRSILS